MRRVVASAGTSTLDDKASIVRRITKGAGALGATRFLTNREPHRIVARATETQRVVTVDYVDLPIDNTENDTCRAVAAMRDAGCALVIVLGGDGTNRAAAKGWPGLAVVPLSTGTNNAFPYWCEPTVAGMAAALIATGAVALDEGARPAKIVHVDVDGEAGDIALVDAVAVDDPVVGSLELFDPATMRIAVLTQANPAAIGFAAVGGLLSPLAPGDDAALVVEFTDPARAAAAIPRLLAPTAPGHLAEVAVASVRRIALGEVVAVAGPTILAFDGERKRRVAPGATARLCVRRDGPKVVDAGAIMRRAALDGLLSRRALH